MDQHGLCYNFLKLIQVSPIETNLLTSPALRGNMYHRQDVACLSLERCQLSESWVRSFLHIRVRFPCERFDERRTDKWRLPLSLAPDQFICKTYQVHGNARVTLTIQRSDTEIFVPAANVLKSCRYQSRFPPLCLPLSCGKSMSIKCDNFSEIFVDFGLKQVSCR